MFIDKKEVLRYMAGSKMELSDDLSILIDYTIQKCIDNIKPRLLYGRYSLINENNGFLLKGTDIILSGNLANQRLKDATEILVIIATLTNTSERMLTSSTSMLDKLALDATLTAMLESYLDEIEDDFRIKVKDEGYILGDRFSCGYGDLDLGIQPSIIRLLQAEKLIGVCVNESLMLIPNKSVTAFCSIGKKDFKKNDICNCKIDCRFRRNK